MRMMDLIDKKVAGQSLTTEEIRFVVDNFTKGIIPDYQMSAFMMAVVFRGMDDREVSDLTLAMMNSGDVIDLSRLPGIKVDKHSTGGVGDTTTLIVAPVVAACGGTVAKMSGRGLGHTGGTLDKLESIPGLNVEQSTERFFEIVEETGIAVIGQSGNLDPADKKMYALRDVTGTVRSIPLIASSIMSKKLAAGADAIVLDVKVGSGAFMRTTAEAKALSETMVRIGKSLGKQVVALITDMNQPLGAAVGNAFEVRDAVLVLSGKVGKEDILYRISSALASEMLVLCGLAESAEAAGTMFDAAIADGSGLNKLREMVRAEGGDASYIDCERIDELCDTKYSLEIKAAKNGYLSAVDTVSVGKTAQLLGAGRATKEDIIDSAVGLIVKKRIGEKIMMGDTLAILYYNDETRIAAAKNCIATAFSITEEQADTVPLIYEIVR